VRTRRLSYAEWHDHVTILFADIVGFTAMSTQVSAWPGCCGLHFRLVWLYPWPGILQLACLQAAHQLAVHRLGLEVTPSPD
jgi:hypothetical protein